MPSDSNGCVPDGVQQLIDEHITSVEQLEILLLLAARPDLAWTPKQVCEEIRTSPSSAVSRLEDLRARGFLAAVDGGAEGAYRYQPGCAAMRTAVAQLADVYRERRFTIIDLIFSKPIDRLRVYADAFRFRKEKPGG